jgi:hypothetical protein
MKTFYCYIKSHCEAPDWEDECEAETKEEAAHIFLNKINQNNEDPWSEDELLRHINEVQ